MSDGMRCGDFGGIAKKNGEPCRHTVQEEGQLCPQHSEEGPAGLDRTVRRPQDWDKAVSAAYLWLLADSIKAAAEGAGIGERTLQRWVKSSWWPDACREAEHRWLNHLVAESQRTLMRAIQEGDADKALRILERRMSELRPPTQDFRVGVFGAIATLPPDDVSRILALPEADRHEELRKLLEPKGSLPERAG